MQNSSCTTFEAKDSGERVTAVQNNFLTAATEGISLMLTQEAQGQEVASL